MKRRDFVGIAAVGAAAVASCKSVGGGDRGRKPNIIYIMADDLGYGHLGCYGQTEIKTPNIDRMAEEGMLFTDHYAGSALCAPSRCVLMTGLHTGHCYVRGNRPLPVEGNVPIPADTQTVPKIMKTAGYATGCIGKWGLGYPGSEGDPINQGFDHFFGYNCQRQAHTYYPDHLWRNDVKVMLDGNVGKEDKTDYSHDLMTEEALWFIGEHRDDPFFLYVPYTIPHAKFQAPDLGIYANKPWPDVKKSIAAMITRMDRDVGTIIELVKELGLESDTLIMFLSDNGCAGGSLLNEFDGSGPLRGQKSGMYEGGIRVPLIARWPGRIAPGSTSNHISCFQDMMPTFAELGGASVPKPTDGISMIPTLLGQGGQKKHEYLYWELGGKRAVRMGDWKAVQLNVDKQPDALELYNLKDDLGETTDLAADRPDLVDKMLTIIKTSHTDTPWYEWTYDGPMPEGAEKKKKKRG